MKKLHLITALFVLGFSTISLASDEVELLPELKELLTPKPLNTDLLEKSMFIGLLGISNPDNNYYEVSKQLFSENYPILSGINASASSKDLISIQSKIPKGQKELDWSSSLNKIYGSLKLCSEYLVENCVQRTIESRAELELLMAENQKIFQRYDDLVRNSEQHAEYSKMWFLEHDSGIDLLQAYHGINKYNLLALNQALLQLDNNEIDEAIDKLQRVQKSLWLLAADNESVSVISQMLAVSYRSNFDMYLNAILDYGYLNDQLDNPAIEKLFKPYPETYRQGIIKTFSVEYILNLRALINSEKFQADNNALNEYHLLGKKYLKSLQNNTFDEDKRELFKSCEAINIKGKVFCGYSIDDYFKRYDVQSNYHNMVYLKYLILKNKIKDKDIPQFLKSQGNIAIDPITQEAFKWNSGARTISLPLPASKFLPAQIRMDLMKNPEKKYPQVMIAK